MKRLTELPETDRLVARANTLVRALGPTIESAERMHRVRRLLDAPSRAAAPRWAWRAAVATGLLGASAAAAGTAALSGVFDRPSAATPIDVLQAPPVRAQLPTEPAPAASAGAPVTTQPSAPGAQPGATARSSAAAPRSAAPLLSDVARVHEAAKALRHDADPERALRLLERPGARITGPLAEEALALRIEASAARGDGRAAQLAAAYLEQYPNGRYRDLAKKSLASRTR